MLTNDVVTLQVYRKRVVCPACGPLKRVFRYTDEAGWQRIIAAVEAHERSQRHIARTFVYVDEA